MRAVLLAARSPAAGRVRVTIRIVARDAAGNTAVRRVRPGVVRRR
jgi:hypothetical protein